MSISRRALLRGTAGASLFPLTDTVFSQPPYPVRPVRLVVPYPAGGTFDAIARLLAAKLINGLGQPVIVENKPGANGMIAISSVAKSPADGYTLLISGTSLVLNFASFKSVSYRLDELSSVGGLVDMPLAIGVNPNFPATNFSELVSVIKASPDGYSISTSGTVEEIIVARLRKSADLKLRTIPYSGAAPSLNAVAGGVVPMIITAAGAAQQLHAAGKIRLLALTGSKPLNTLPGVPTLSQVGISDGDLSSWCGVLAPAQTPEAVFNRLSKEIEQVMHSSDVVAKVESLSMAVHARDAGQFAKFLDGESVKWKRAALDAEIMPS